MSGSNRFPGSGRTIDAVVIGASAGAVDAFMRILPGVPSALAKPIVSVIHIPRDKESLLPEVFQRKCSLRVKEAEDRELLADGTLYLAPPDHHVLIERGHVLSLSGDEPVWFSRPSIDVLFESAADVYEDRLLGIVLTGASPDGANGLHRICESGGLAVVQRPSSAFASEMPQSALDACPDAAILDLDEIAGYLADAFAEGHR